MRKSKMDKDLFPCAGRASLALGGNSRAVLGVQMVPKWLCSQERFRVHGCPELQSWDLLVQHHSHHCVGSGGSSFLLGRGAEAGARGGLPTMPAVGAAHALDPPCPASHLPSSTPTRTSSQCKFTKNHWTEWLTLCTHARSLCWWWLWVTQPMDTTSIPHICSKWLSLNHCKKTEKGLVENKYTSSIPFTIHARKRCLLDWFSKMFQAVLSHQSNLLSHRWLRGKRQEQKRQRHFHISPVVYSGLLFIF